jgi:serine/threonine-protein kinase
MATLLERRGSIPVAEAISYVLQACEGLSEAHGIGIVHRDLKPENLFLAVRPEGVVLKILDFGISKDVGSSIREGRRTTLTKGGAAIGSPSYMAPEQIRAEPNLDARADIWSLGTILFELLTGRCPFEAETVALMYQKVLTEDPPSLLDFVPDAPHELNTIIRLCLQKNADDRFQTVQELVSALRGLSRPVVMPRPRQESGIMMIPAAAEATPGGVSLSVKLGLFATTALLVAASVAFWQLQVRTSPARALSQAVSAPLPSSSPKPPAPLTPRAAPAPVAEVAPIAKPEPWIAPPPASAQKPEPPPRPAPAPNWPPPRKPVPFSAGSRYGL